MYKIIKLSRLYSNPFPNFYSPHALHNYRLEVARRIILSHVDKMTGKIQIAYIFANTSSLVLAKETPSQ
jgi:hypothetical protein